MFGIYTQFGLSSKYSYYKNLISNRANFAVCGPIPLYIMLTSFISVSAPSKNIET